MGVFGGVRRGVRRHSARPRWQRRGPSGESSAESAFSLMHKPRYYADDARRARPYALQATTAIAALRDREPSVEIEIHWCPTRSRTDGPSSPPASRTTTGWSGWRMPMAYDDLTANLLAHLKRRASEKKWPEARSWCERRRLNKDTSSGRKASRPTPARVEKRTASRFYQLKSGHALTGVYLKSTDNRPDDHCW